MDKMLKGKPLTLTDADVSSARSVSRRSLLSTLGIGLGAAAAAIVGGPTTVVAQRSGCTDTDRGRNEDREGRGKRCRRETGGCTDNDRGRNEDAPGRGKGCWI